MFPKKETAVQQTSQKPMNVPVPSFSLPQVRIGAIVAVALAALFIVWLTTRSDNKSAPKGPTSAVAVSTGDLKKVAASVAFPVYWAGQKSGTTYELTHTSDGRIYVRYLPSSDKVGDAKPNYLTIGTYPRRNAYAELKRAARQNGNSTRPLPHGGLAVFNRLHPTNIYFGYPNRHYQVEVFDPSARAAAKLVLGGMVVPIK